MTIQEKYKWLFEKYSGEGVTMFGTIISVMKPKIGDSLFIKANSLYRNGVKQLNSGALDVSDVGKISKNSNLILVVELLYSKCKALQETKY